MTVKALHHVNVTVPSRLEAAAKEFYGSVLGLEQVPKPPAARQSGAWYQIGGNQLHLSVEDEAPELSSRHVCFTVFDLKEAEQKFRDADVEIIPDTRPLPGSSRFYVRDPGGNQLEIVQASVESQRANSMSFTFINPESLGVPSGYANGVSTASSGRLLFVAGQIGWDRNHKMVSTDLVEQFDSALANVITVVTEAGGTAEQIARLVIYVIDKNEYKEHLKEIGERYRARMGKHFPAMVLVEVKSLLEDAAKIEIEATAVL